MLLTDDGAGDPAVRAGIVAAQAAAGGVAAYLQAIVRLGGARLYLPFVDRREPGARRPEMAAVSLQAATGERCLLGFTGTDAVHAWNPAAWPRPATLHELAATAVEAGATEIVLDVAGPVPFTIGQDVCAELAAGRRLVALSDGFGWAEVADPQSPDFGPGAAIR